MRIKYGDIVYELEIDADLIDFSRARVADNKTVYAPYCNDLDYFYSPRGAKLREALWPHISQIISENERNVINYARPSIWLVIDTTLYIRLAVTYNWTNDGVWVYDDALERKSLRCFTTEDEKKDIIDKIRFLW